MDIVVIGACGDVGRQVVQLIVSERLLQCDQRLILVAHRDGASERSIHGIAADLTDAYAESAPRIDIVLDPDAIRGDLVVMAAGATISPRKAGTSVDRGALAAGNAPVFERYARAIADHGHGHEIVICISNPNELAVGIFAKHLGRRRVIGMGAFLDTLRFRKEIAADLGVRRQRIHGFMVGEHGTHGVPLWSGVHAYGLSDSELAVEIQRIRRGHRTEAFFEDVARAHVSMGDRIAAGEIREAYALLADWPPDIRVLAKPFATHFSGAKTVTATAEATMELLRTITQGSDVLISGQIALAGEVYGIHGVIGVPFVVGNRGVDRIFEMPMTGEERELLAKSAAAVQRKLDGYL